MFDFDAGKLLILGIVALVVIGPKELPGVMRQVGQAVAKLRRMAAEFQGQFMEAMREAELDDLKQELTKVGEAAKEATRIDDFNPVADVQREMTAAMADPTPVENPAAPAAKIAETRQPALPLPAPAVEPAPAKPVRRKRQAKAPVEGEGQTKPKPRRRRQAAAPDPSVATSPLPVPPAERER
jgi:sec-independent protein translocase protein TatB